MKTVIIVSKCVITNIVKNANSASFDFKGKYKGQAITRIDLAIPAGVEMPLFGTTYLIYAAVADIQDGVLHGKALKLKETKNWDGPAMDEV